MRILQSVSENCKNNHNIPNKIRSALIAKIIGIWIDAWNRAPNDKKPKNDLESFKSWLNFWMGKLAPISFAISRTYKKVFETLHSISDHMK